jgi:flagellar hook-length control protein FliK
MTQGGSAVSELTASSPGESAVSFQRLSAQSHNSAVADPVAARAPGQSLGEQILDSIQASVARGDRQVLIRLQPPELGAVLMRFQEQGERVSGVLEVSNRDARRDIEQALPQVLRSLQEAGVQVRRLDVVPSDPPERDPGREPFQQDAAPQHQGTGQGREHMHGSPHPGGTRDMDGYEPGRQETPDDEPAVTVEPDRIDLLL